MLRKRAVQSAGKEVDSRKESTEGRDSRGSGGKSGEGAGDRALFGLSGTEWNLCGFAACTHAGFCILTQLETYAIFLYPLPAETPERMSPEAFTQGLLIGQGQILLVAMLIGMVVTLPATRVGGSIMTPLCALLFFVANIYLCVDQAAYSVQFQHISLSQAERVPDSRMLSTLFGSGLNLFFQPLFVINFLLVITATRFFSRATKQRPYTFLFFQTFAALLALHVIASVLFGVVPDEHLLKTLFKAADAEETLTSRIANIAAVRPGSPLLGLGKSIHYDLIKGEHDHVAKKKLTDVNGPRHHGLAWKASEEDKKEAEHLETFANALRSRWAQKGRKPTIITFHHEGVGALNVLNQTSGEVDPIAAPFLHKIQKQALTFSRMYTTFPSTLRSFIPLLTGGYTGTRGDILGQSQHEFANASVVSLLKDLGYKSAFVASGTLGFEGLDKFLMALKYDHFRDFDDFDAEDQVKFKLTGWGARDDETVNAALAWIDKEMENKDENRPPLFLSVFPCNTHHPYKVPEEFAAEHPLENYAMTKNAADGVYGAMAGQNSEARSKYRRSVAFVDHCLELLVEGLRARGLLEDALVLVSGDHGESFGELHPANRLHKNELFEENLAVFSVFAPYLNSEPKLPSPDLPSPLISHRIGRLGDFLPTIASLLSPHRLKLDEGDKRWSRNALTPHGQDLFAGFGQYKTPMLFFHKTANPSKYGLRDGRYKFISEPKGGLRRLYDLALDPTEQHDLSEKAEYDELVQDYDDLSVDWMRKMHCEWATSLRGYDMAETACDMPEVRVQTASERARARTSGAKQQEQARDKGKKQKGKALVLQAISVGVMRPKSSRDAKPKFAPAPKLHPLQSPITILTEWDPLPSEQTVIYEIQGIDFDTPDLAFRFTLQQGWHTSRYQIKPKAPLAEGRWRALVRDSFGAVIGEKEFAVDASATIVHG